MIYIFHRAEGFYPLSLGSDLEAIANAHQNPGTVKVTDSENRVVFDAEAARAIPDAEADLYIDLVLRASGSALRHYTLEKSKTDMRAAMRTAISAAGLLEGIRHA